MVRNLSKLDKKIAYDTKICQFLDDYTRVLVVSVDNVGSNQLQAIRRGLRGDSVILMGKNTMMKRSVRNHAENTGNRAILNLIPLLVGNVGLIFTKGDLKEVREEVAKYKVGAPARVGLVAPVDVVVPPGNTGLDPSQTSFFQVLNIPTKINKGTVEIITPVELIKKGDKVGSSEAALLAKLGIRPFSYGLIVQSVYDNGSVFSPDVLDLTEDDLVIKFSMGVNFIASLALAVSYPTIAAAPHMLINAYKNVLALALMTGYSFPLADPLREYVDRSALGRIAHLPDQSELVCPYCFDFISDGESTLRHVLSEHEAKVVELSAMGPDLLTNLREYAHYMISDSDEELSPPSIHQPLTAVDHRYYDWVERYAGDLACPFCFMFVSDVESTLHHVLHVHPSEASQLGAMGPDLLTTLKEYVRHLNLMPCGGNDLW